MEKYEILRKHRIYSLVVMDVDVLNLYSDQFEKTGLFVSLWMSILKMVDKKKIRLKFTQQPTEAYMESLIMKTIQPFNGFIKDKLKVTSVAF